MNGLDSLAEREKRFLERVQGYRERLRRLEDVRTAAYALERDFDYLLMEAANLAREPLVRHMALAMQHAAALSPSPFQLYPDPKKGAES